MNERSKQVRRDAITLARANGGYHFGGSFSCAEILIHLFDNVLTKDDIFILSKGHGCWCYYVLLIEQGFKPLLEGHPHIGNGIPCTSGSLGHGFPYAIGIAMAKRLKGEKGNVYVLLGDGECQEGSTWESILIGGNQKLNNLKVIVDYNGIQGSGFVAYISPVKLPLINAAESAGWDVSFTDGHDNIKLKGNFIIANTVKGKGISFMENKPEWHSKWIDDECLKICMEELK